MRSLASIKQLSGLLLFHHTPFTLHWLSAVHENLRRASTTQERLRRIIPSIMQVMELNKGTEETWNCLGNGDNAEVHEDYNKDAGVLYNEQSSVEIGPLRLHLTKSDSLVNMIQSALDQQASKEKTRYTRADAYHNISGTPCLTNTILKPSHFHASCLRIGTWEWKSKYDKDLVAKFYYINNKLMWEILSEGRKSKIEIDWKTISALKVNIQENEPVTLEIMLSQVPKFCTETDPQPRMSTKWKKTIDFTNGQASMYRRHFLQCAPGILDEHIAKLLSSNQRLYSLSKENNINQMNPLFEQFYYNAAASSENVQDLHCYYNYPQSAQQFEESVSMLTETNTVRRNHNESQDTMHVLIPSSVQVSSKNTTMTPSGHLQFNRDMFTYNSSSSSQTLPNAQWDAWNVKAQHMISPGKPLRQNLLTSGLVIRETQPTNQTISSGIPLMFYDDPLNQNRRELVGASNYAFNLPGSDDSHSAATLLEKISHDLLNDNYSIDATDAADEAAIMSRVNSFCSLLLQDPAPATVHAAVDPPVNIEVEAPPQLLDGEGDNSLPTPPHMEHQPMWDIDMDMEFLMDILPFNP